MQALHDDIIDSILETLCLWCGSEDEHSCTSPKCDSICKLEAARAERTATLAALCRVSGNMNKLATRHLYHGPSLDSEGALVRTLGTRPDLANHVRQLSTGQWGSCVSWRYYLDGDWSEFCLLRAMRKCSRLEKLDSLGHIPLGPVGGLKIATLRGLGAGASSIAPWDIRIMFAAARKLETLVVYRLEERDYDLDWSHFGGQTGIRHLRLHESSIHRETLDQILRRTPELSTFVYGAAGSDVPLNSSGDVQFSPREGARLLARHAPGLTQLRMEFASAGARDADLADGWAGVADLYDGWVEDADLADGLVEDADLADGWVVSSLTGLTKLQLLTIDISCLLSSSPRNELVFADLLPPSIREVRILGNPRGPGLRRLGPALSKLASAAPAQFLDLSVVEVRGAEALEGVGDRRGDMEAAGIKFVVSEMSYST